MLERAEPGRIYHLTSDTPSTMEELALFCEEFLRLKGIEICYGSQPEAAAPNPAEALFNKLIDQYRPYLSDTRHFDRSNTDAATGGHAPPRLSYEIFQRCMEYAMRVNWGSAAPTPS